MEKLRIGFPRRSSQFWINFKDSSEHWPAEFHPPLESFGIHEPFCCVSCVRTRPCALQGKSVPPETDFDIGRRVEAVRRIEVMDMSRWQ